MARLHTRLNVAIMLLIVSVLGQVFASPVMAAESDDAAYLSQWLNQPELVFEGLHVPTTTLRQAYQARNFQPLWVDGQGLSERGKAALAQIEKAGDEGLNPELYGISTIHRVAAMTGDDAQQQMQVRLSLEVMMSYAVLHYTSDMQGGYAKPQWDTGLETLNTQEQIALLKSVGDAPDVTAYLQSLTPQSADYAALKTGFKHYQQIAANGGWPSFGQGTKLKPGAADARSAALKQILESTGDLTVAASDTHYDAALVAAVKQFQSRHSIDADGVIGASTQHELNVPVGKRIEQMAMTMERMRWMPHSLGDRYVLVNIPAYKLRAVANGQQLAMNVIVGKTTTPTPMFSKNITNIVFNPSWGVPQKIAVKEMLPKMQHNPNYLTNAGYTLTENGQEIDPNTVDWNAVGKNNFAYSISQKPGDGNALGKVKFLIPDSDDIYLHDTSNHGLFAKAERDLSHGCVRLSDPEALTKFVLTSEGWSEKKFESHYDSDESRTVAIKPLPVYFVYWTSWVDGKGAPHFERDIYGKDDSLMAALNMKPARDDIKLAMN